MNNLALGIIVLMAILALIARQINIRDGGIDNA